MIQSPVRGCFVFAVVLSLVACNSEKRNTTSEPATAASAKDAASEAKLRTMIGKVEKKPWSKSLESWHAGGSDYFVLHVEGGETVILRPSEKVSLHDLNTAVGKKVRVEALDVPYEPYEPANPTEQYPTGMDGKPIPRGGGIRAQSLAVIE